jgi:hypothetical protein
MANRNFLTRTKEDDHDAVMDAVHGRENELASYDANVEGYTQQLTVMDAELPKEWPKGLLKFKGKTNEQLFAIGGTTEELELASRLNHRERVRMLLFTEKAERRKSEGSYSHCLDSLPKDTVELEAAKQRHAAKIAAQKAKNL